MLKHGPETPEVRVEYAGIPENFGMCFSIDWSLARSFSISGWVNFCFRALTLHTTEWDAPQDIVAV
jgi:hypothetical protein